MEIHQDQKTSKSVLVDWLTNPVILWCDLAFLCVLMNCLQTSSGFQLCYSPKHLASRHYLSSALSAFSFGL